MEAALTFYSGGALMTAIYLHRLNPPHGAEWLGFVAFVVGWPILFLCALYWAVIKC
jgi:hypothetical protein